MIEHPNIIYIRGNSKEGLLNRKLCVKSAISGWKSKAGVFAESQVIFFSEELDLINKELKKHD